MASIKAARSPERWRWKGAGAFCRGTTVISRTLEALTTAGALPLRDYAYDPGWCGRYATDEQKARAEN